jgi:DNA-binding MarR family transcriptional regulator
MTSVVRGHEDDVEAAMAASRALLGVVVRSMGHALEKVTLPQYRILVVLSSNGPMRSGDLAEQIGVHQSTLTRTADRLVAGGWVRRETSSESRREVLIDLTRTGRALVAEGMAHRRREIEAILGSADERSRKAILRGFKAFARAAGEPDAGELLSIGL